MVTYTKLQVTVRDKYISHGFMREIAVKWSGKALANLLQ